MGRNESEMIGHKEVINLIAKKKIKAVIVYVGKKPNWYKPHEMNSEGDKTGLIYTETSRPKKGDMSFLKNQFVQLIHGAEASDELFSKWFIEVVDSKPKKLMAVDSEMEIYVN